MVSRAAAAARGRVDEHVFLRKHRKSANRFREGDLFAWKKTRDGFPAMSHVCRTWKTPDNTREIGAVIDITGRRVCPIAFCSCKVLPRKSHPPSPISLRSPSDNRISRTRRIRGVAYRRRNFEGYELKISFQYMDFSNNGY